MTKEKELNEEVDGEETVTVSKADFEELKSRLAAVENGGNYRARRPKRVMEHTAKIALFNGIPVIGWDYVKGHEDLVINLHLSDGTKVQQDYLKFLNKADRVLVKILNQEAKEYTVVDTRDGGGGIINKVNPMTDNFMDTEIELEVTRVDYESEVEIMEGDLAGKKLKISNNFLNI